MNFKDYYNDRVKTGRTVSADQLVKNIATAFLLKRKDLFEMIFGMGDRDGPFKDTRSRFEIDIEHFSSDEFQLAWENLPYKVMRTFGDVDLYLRFLKRIEQIIPHTQKDIIADTKRYALGIFELLEIDPEDAEGTAKIFRGVLDFLKPSGSHVEEDFLENRRYVNEDFANVTDKLANNITGGDLYLKAIDKFVEAMHRIETQHGTTAAAAIIVKMFPVGEEFTSHRSRQIPHLMTWHPYRTLKPDLHLMMGGTALKASIDPSQTETALDLLTLVCTNSYAHEDDYALALKSLEMAAAYLPTTPENDKKITEICCHLYSEIHRDTDADQEIQTQNIEKIEIAFLGRFNVDHIGKIDSLLTSFRRMIREEQVGKRTIIEEGFWATTENLFRNKPPEQMFAALCETHVQAPNGYSPYNDDLVKSYNDCAAKLSPADMISLTKDAVAKLMIKTPMALIDAMLSYFENNADYIMPENLADVSLAIEDKFLKIHRRVAGWNSDFVKRNEKLFEKSLRDTFGGETAEPISAPAPAPL